LRKYLNLLRDCWILKKDSAAWSELVTWAWIFKFGSIIFLFVNAVLTLSAYICSNISKMKIFTGHRLEEAKGKKTRIYWSFCCVHDIHTRACSARKENVVDVLKYLLYVYHEYD
jgi:hypothetical protein